jgi:hypothetical protein
LALSAAKFRYDERGKRIVTMPRSIDEVLAGLQEQGLIILLKEPAGGIKQLPESLRGLL